MNIYYLIYLSAASEKFGMDEEELDKILVSARQNNREMGITGALLYIDGDFIQMLEGEEEQVKKLFTKISKDSRHGAILRVSEGRRSSRLFSDWYMGYKKLKKSDFDHLDGYLNLKDKLTNFKDISDPSHPAVKLMENFYQLHSLRIH